MEVEQTPTLSLLWRRCLRSAVALTNRVCHVSTITSVTTVTDEAHSCRGSRIRRHNSRYLLNHDVVVLCGDVTTRNSARWLCGVSVIHVQRVPCTWKGGDGGAQMRLPSQNRSERVTSGRMKTLAYVTVHKVHSRSPAAPHRPQHQLAPSPPPPNHLDGPQCHTAPVHSRSVLRAFAPQRSRP